MKESDPVIDPTYLVNDLGDVVRGETAGYNFRRTGRYVELIPRISKSDFLDLGEVRKDGIPMAVEALLTEFPDIPDAEKKKFIATRKIVEGANGQLSIVPKVPRGLDEVEVDPADDIVGPSAADLASRSKKRRYNLAQIFTDVSIADKYSVTGRLMGTSARMAATNPVQAASMLQDAMNDSQTDVAVTVTAGAYANSRTQAKITIRGLCKSYRLQTATVQSLVVGDELFLFGPGGEQDWHVCGPLEHAYSVHDVYRLVACRGSTDVQLLLGMEMVMLHINIQDMGSYAAPDMDYHVGDVNSADSDYVDAQTAAMLTAAHRTELNELAKRLEPVSDSEGNQLATAVRVTDRHVLVNSHVLDSTNECRMEGKAFALHKLVARDVWAAFHPGDATSWRIRDAEVGENVAVMYRQGDCYTLTSPLQVVSVDENNIVTTKASDVIHGSSGGALVGLNDLSLLGIHCAETNRNLVSYAFGIKQFAELLEGDEVSTVSRLSGDEESFGANILKIFKKKGLAHVLSSVMASLKPVYMTGKHIGMAVGMGEHLYTTCDPSLPLRYGNERLPLVMDVVSGQLHRCDNPFQDLTIPAFRRRPNYFEKVFVVGFDHEDAYISAESMVAHVGPNAKTFVLKDIPGADKPLLGGLVVGWDGAVLGQCGARSASTPSGLGHYCYALPDVAKKVISDPVQVLANKFPFLNVAAWGDDLIEEIFTHVSVGEYKKGRTFNAGCKPLANVGDNAAKAALYAKMRDSLVPHPTWARVMQVTQSNSAYARMAWDFGYASCLKVGAGAQLPKDSKAYADLTEALLGAAFLMEKFDVFAQLCDAMKVTDILEKG